jgi:hypothetical protein
MLRKLETKHCTLIFVRAVLAAVVVRVVVVVGIVVSVGLDGDRQCRLLLRHANCLSFATLAA